MENDIKIMPKAIVCEDSTLLGDITISGGCVIHTSATIIAEAGPIVLGENCIVEEYAKIKHRLPKDQEQVSSNVPNTSIMMIGANNVFEVGCFVEALKIGEKNVFECKSYVSPLVQVSSGCIVGAGCRVQGEHILPENTVVYGHQCFQREAMEKQGSQSLQIDSLRRILPNYHHLRKATLDAKRAKT